MNFRNEMMSILISMEDKDSMNPKQYLLITKQSGGVMPGEIWEISNETRQSNDYYIIKYGTSKRWVEKRCGVIISKETHPEYYL